MIESIAKGKARAWSKQRRIALSIVVLGGILACAAWLARPDGHLHIFFFDTPGDAVLVQTPHGRFVLIDGGNDPALLALHLGRRLPFWRRSLDAVVLTQYDDARLPGQIAALTRYRADLALAPPGELQSASAQEWLRLLESQRTPVHTARMSERLTLDNVALTVLTTGDGDESGLVLRLDYGASSVVLDGAGGEPDEDRLLTSAHPITALAYPWQRELDTPLLAAWQPQAIIFTTAQEADEPALLTYRERALRGAALYHARIDGTVELVSNGRHAWIVTERGR